MPLTYFKNMRVIYRFFLSAIIFGTCFCAQGQIKGPGGLSFYRVHQLNNPGGLFNVVTVTRPSIFETEGRLKGALVIGVQPLPGHFQGHVGESTDLSLNGPVFKGESIVIKGKTLTMASVNVDIVNEKGETIGYAESKVRFDQEQNRLEINVNLPPGFYTIQIPVTDGVASKTVIVQ